METIISGRWFEWDEIKSMINESKHGVTFQDAALVFEDEYKITRKDIKHSQNEERFQTIGMVEDVENQGGSQYVVNKVKKIFEKLK